jgi:putative transposase
MARRRHTTEWMIRTLREREWVLARRKDLGELGRHLEVSEQTWHRWRNQYGGMKAEDTQRLKELERENPRLKSW